MYTSTSTFLRWTFSLSNIRYIFELAPCHGYSSSIQNRRYKNHVWNKENDTFWRYALYILSYLTRPSLTIFTLHSFIKFLACNFTSESIFLDKKKIYLSSWFPCGCQEVINWYHYTPLHFVKSVPNFHIFSISFVFLPYAFLSFCKKIWKLL